MFVHILLSLGNSYTVNVDMCYGDRYWSGLNNAAFLNDLCLSQREVGL